MLDFIRQNAGSWLVKFILGAIVLVFIFWGVGSFRAQRVSTVAKVNGEEISQQAYNQAYARAMEQYTQMFGGRIPEGFLKQVNLKKMVLEGLIREALLKQGARQLGIQVADAEVQQAILSIPAFKNNGTFDQMLYQRALHNAHVTPTEFEGQMRSQLLQEKLGALLGAGLEVPNDEAKAFYLYSNEEIDLSYLSIPGMACGKDVKVTDEALQTYYDQNKERYRTEPQLKVRYLLFGENQIGKDVTVSDAAVRDYYEAHKAEYEEPERRQASHILIRVPEGAAEPAVEAARQKAESIYERLKKGEDFATLAKKFSQDQATAASGGELGFFPRGKMVAPFDQQAFSMKAGEISPPVRTPFGWHIIRLEKVEPAKTRSFDEVKGEIAARLKEQRIKDLLWKEANNAYDSILQAGSLEAYADMNGTKLETTDFFNEKSAPAVFGDDAQTLRALFGLQPGELSSILVVPRGLIIAEILEKKAPYIPDFAAVKGSVKGDYIFNQSLVLCQKKAEDILAEAKKEGLEKAAKKAGYKVEETGFFKRTDRTAAGKLPIPVAKVGAGLYEGKVLPDGVVKSGDTSYLLAFKAKKEASMAGFAAQQEAITKQLLRDKMNTVLDTWVNGLRQKAEVKISTEM